VTGCPHRGVAKDLLQVRYGSDKPRRCRCDAAEDVHLIDAHAPRIAGTGMPHPNVQCGGEWRAVVAGIGAAFDPQINYLYRRTALERRVI